MSNRPLAEAMPACKRLRTSSSGALSPSAPQPPSPQPAASRPLSPPDHEPAESPGAQSRAETPNHEPLSLSAHELLTLQPSRHRQPLDPSRLSPLTSSISALSSSDPKALGPKSFSSSAHHFAQCPLPMPPHPSCPNSSAAHQSPLNPSAPQPLSSQPLSSQASSFSLQHLLPFGILPRFPIRWEAQESPEPSGRKVTLRSSNRSFSSLGEALRSAKRGDQITLTPGVYTEPQPLLLQIDGITIMAAEPQAPSSCPPSPDPLSYSGDEMEHDAAIESDQAGESECKEGAERSNGAMKGRGVKIICRNSGPHGIVCKAWGCEIKGISFAQGAPGAEEVAHQDVDRCCISIAGGDCKFTDCSVASSAGYGMMVWGFATPRVEGCAFSGCKHAAIICGGYSRTHFQANELRDNEGFGIVVVDSAAGDFIENSVSANGKCGIVSAGASEPSFAKNSVSHGMQGGYWLRDETRCVIQDCRIFGNARVGIQVSDDSDPRVSGNIISNGRNGGIVVHERAKGIFENNIIKDNAQAGIGVMDAASPTFIGNTLTGNAAGGAVMAGSATATLLSNTLTDNGFAGIGLKEQARPLLEDNKIENNRGYGVLIHGSSEAILQRCHVEGNQNSGICASGLTSVTLFKCVVKGGSGNKRQRTGIQIQDEASMTAVDCTVTSHTGSNLFVRDRSSLKMQGGCISAAHGAGIVLQGSCKAVIHQASCIDNRVCNIITLDDASASAVRVALSDSRGAGFIATGNSKVQLEGCNFTANSGTGLYGSTAACIKATRCRFSGNGGAGISLEQGSEGHISQSIFFENCCSSLHIEGSSVTAEISGNLLLGATVPQQGSNQTGAARRSGMGAGLAQNVTPSPDGDLDMADAESVDNEGFAISPEAEEGMEGSALHLAAAPAPEDSCQDAEGAEGGKLLLQNNIIESSSQSIAEQNVLCEEGDRARLIEWGLGQLESMLQAPLPELERADEMSDETPDNSNNLNWKPAVLLEMPGGAICLGR